MRDTCLQPAECWTPPVGTEIREALATARLTHDKAARILGLGKGGGRTVRRWVSEDSAIPYASWALLCSFAGHGLIWWPANSANKNQENKPSTTL